MNSVHIHIHIHTNCHVLEKLFSISPSIQYAADSFIHISFCLVIFFLHTQLLIFFPLVFLFGGGILLNAFVDFESGHKKWHFVYSWLMVNIIILKVLANCLYSKKKSRQMNEMNEQTKNSSEEDEKNRITEFKALTKNKRERTNARRTAKKTNNSLSKPIFTFAPYLCI